MRWNSHEVKRTVPSPPSWLKGHEWLAIKVLSARAHSNYKVEQVRALTAHAARPIAQLAFIAIFFMRGVRSIRRDRLAA